MPIYKKNGKYYAKVNFKSDGKYKSVQSKYYETKREAKEQETILLSNVGKQNKTITFSEAHSELKTLKRTNNTHSRTIAKRENYFRAIGDLTKKRVNEITQKDIDDLKIKLRENYADETIKGILAYVKEVVKYASQKHNVQCNYLDITLPKKKEPKKELNFYTFDEFEKLSACFDDDVYKTLFDLLFYNGLRISEARGLTFKDFDGNKISINKQYYKAFGLEKSLKTSNSYRTLPLNSLLIEEFNQIKEYYSKFPGFSDDWHIFGGIKPFAQTSIRFALDKATEKAKVKRIRVHDFRHSCASYYIHLGFAMHLIAELLGDDINTVNKTYYHLYQNDLTNMIKSAEIRG